MKKPHNQPQHTGCDAQQEQPTMRHGLPDGAAFKPGAESDLNDFDVNDSALLHFVQTLVPLTGENHDQWTCEERRDFLNWCLDEGVLTIKDGRLIPVEEPVPTAPLPHDTDADASKSTEDAGFLRDVERAAPVIAANPTLSAKELVDACEWNSALNVYTMKMSVNAHKSAKKGAE
jgi:hypothetical protein